MADGAIKYGVKFLINRQFKRTVFCQTMQQRDAILDKIADIISANFPKQRRVKDFYLFNTKDADSILGKGSFGTVYKARKIQKSTLSATREVAYAIKVIEKNSVPDKALLQL